MAAPPTPDVENLREMLDLMIKLGSKAGEIVGKSGEIGGALAKGATEGFDALFKVQEQAKDAAGNAVADASSSIVKIINFGVGQIEGMATAAAKNFAGAFGQLFVGIQGIKPESVAKLVAEIGNFTASHPVQLVVGLNADAAAAMLESSMPGLASKKIMEFSNQVAEAYTAFAGANQLGMTSSEEFNNSITEAMQKASQTMQRLGVDQKAVIDLQNQMAASGVNINKLFDKEKGLKIDLGDGTEPIEAMSAALLLAKGSNLDAASSAKIFAAATQELGYSAADTAGIFGSFNQIQAGSSLSINRVISDTMDAAGSLRMYGGNVESVSSIYKGFIKSMGEGKEALAGGIFKQVISGIADMNDGMRAFIGMTGASGSFGAQGAIGASLEVEKAMETGEGMEGIMEDMKDAIRRATGADIMTREQAMETGQQTQYFAQRQIAGDMLGVSGAGAQNQLMKFLEADDLTGAGDLARGRGAAVSEVARQGQGTLDQQIGPAEQAANRVRAVGLSAIGEMHTDFVNLGKSVTEFTAGPFSTLMNMMSKVGGEKFMAAGGQATWAPGAIKADTDKTPTQLETYVSRRAVTGATTTEGETAAGFHRATGLPEATMGGTHAGLRAMPEFGFGTKPLRPPSFDLPAASAAMESLKPTALSFEPANIQLNFTVGPDFTVGLKDAVQKAIVAVKKDISAGMNEAVAKSTRYQAVVGSP